MFVFLLEHIILSEYEPRLEKIIGIYDSKERAVDQVKYYKSIPGFRDYLDGFVIKRFELFVQGIISTVSKVYLLQHEYSVTCNEEVFDISTDIGVFYSKEDANIVMSQLKNNIMYLNKSDGLYSDNCGFYISEYRLNNNYWVEGFVSDN